MINEKCKELVDHALIKLSDPRSKRLLVISNQQRDTLIRIRFDGCVVKNEVGADWLVTKADVGDLIVELKGSDVNHALEQVNAVAEFLEDHGLRAGKLGAMIVCTRYPKVDSKVLRARSAFAKRFGGGALHVASRSVRVDFEEVISKQSAVLSPHP